MKFLPNALVKEWIMEIKHYLEMSYIYHFFVLSRKI